MKQLRNIYYKKYTGSYQYNIDLWHWNTVFRNAIKYYDIFITTRYSRVYINNHIEAYFIDNERKVSTIYGDNFVASFNGNKLTINFKDYSDFYLELIKK